MKELRSSRFRKNDHLETLLSEINNDLASCVPTIPKYVADKGWKTVLIVGSHRSGTTLFLQWAANTGLFSYPTNLLSRFYGAPVIGAKIQLLLTDPQFNFRNELGEFASQVAYQSTNGKTQGVLAPNEFWYFWRRFLPQWDRDVWNDEELSEAMDVSTLRTELEGISSVFGKPFVAKGMLFNYNIPFLSSALDNVLFVQLRRDPVTNVASVLEARKRQLGDDSKWYSFKIAEFDELKDLDAITQSAGQVHYINRAVSKGLRDLPEDRKIVVDYEKFCENPKRIFDELVEKSGIGPALEYAGPSKFEITRKAVRNEEAIKEAVEHFRSVAPIES